MIKPLLICCFVVFQLTLIASNNNSPIGARSAGMGNASVTLNDFWAVHNNQAGIAGLQNIAAGFYYENRFLIKELSLKSVAFVLPTKSGVFGLSLSYFGFNLYNENKIGLAYAKTFGKYFSAGVQLDYLATSIGEDYGNKSVITFEAGVRAQINENFCLSVHIFNPTRAKFSNYNDERVPTIFKLGASYSFSEKILATLETEKDINYKPLLRGGIEYKIIKEAYARIGYSTNPGSVNAENSNNSSLYTFGFGIYLKKLNIDFASSVHQILGYSPQISAIYKF